MVSNCLSCGTPIESTTKPKKFCSGTCKVKFFREHKAQNVPKDFPPETPLPPNPPDHRDIYDYLPFQIAVYMPVQPWQSSAALKRMFDSLSNPKSCGVDDSDCKF